MRAPDLVRPALAALTVAGFASWAGAEPATDLPAIVATADRQPEPITRTGSAISVVTGEQIRTFSPTSVVDALRNVPGLDVTENGGPGGTAQIRLRGANTGQTLVLIDGIRVNDPSNASGDFDFSTLLPSAIERVEVLRGPQSALYGSDAIGGVVNIMTRSGGGPPKFQARAEAGSYGTVNGSATAFGSYGPWSYAFSGGGQRSAGFSRYGYRIGQLERKFGRFEADGFSRFGGYGRLGYDPGEGVRVEVGAMSFQTDAELDAASSTLPRLARATGPSRIFPDTPGEAERRFTQVFARGTAEQGPLTHSLTVFANQTDRVFHEFAYRGSTARANTTETTTEFYGDRLGTEYQGDLKLGDFGSVIFGGKYEAEKARTFSAQALPVFRPRFGTLDADQRSRALFVLYQLPIGERIVLTAGGRHDEVGARDFDTWRATGAYLIPETGTKLRASGGTGAKAPTLFQRFSPQNGNAALAPETSIGWDAGIDQTLLDGRATASATVFGNKFQDLIEFDSVTQRYRNTSRAKTSGIELEAGLDLVPEWVRVTAAYTYLNAKDEGTGLTLQRRPEHLGRVAVAVTPLAGLLIEPRVTFVSRRFSASGERQPLPRYARLDVYAEYKLDESWRAFVRVENLTDTRYQEVLNYGTTGRAAYAGLSVSW